MASDPLEQAPASSAQQHPGEGLVGASQPQGAQRAHGLTSAQAAPPPARQGAAMPPHEPSAALQGPSNGTSPPVLKALQATALGSAELRQQSGAAPAPAKQTGAAAIAGVPAAVTAEPAGSTPPAAQQPMAAEAQGQQQPQQQAKVSPAAAAAGASPAGSPAGGAAPLQPGPGAAAAADLEALLVRVIQLDAEGWFRHPVQQQHAPNYYKIIKRPMCFEVGGCCKASVAGNCRLAAQWCSAAAACTCCAASCVRVAASPALAEAAAAAGASAALATPPPLRRLPPHPISPRPLLLRRVDR